MTWFCVVKRQERILLFSVCTVKRGDLLISAVRVTRAGGSDKVEGFQSSGL